MLLRWVGRGFQAMKEKLDYAFSMQYVNNTRLIWGVWEQGERLIIPSLSSYVSSVGKLTSKIFTKLLILPRKILGNIYLYRHPTLRKYTNDFC